MKINWAQKLSSRKFWSLLIAQVVSICVIFGLDNNHIVQITAIVGNFGSIVMYMYSEAKVDAARATSETN